MPRGGSGRARWRNLRAPVVTGALVAGATAVLAVRTPHTGGSYGACPVLLLTGLACPACGGLRAVHELTQLNIGAAWALNAAVVLAVPVAVVAWVLWLRVAAGLRPRIPLPPALAWTGLAVFLAFGVLRNLPALRPVLTPWLGP